MMKIEDPEIHLNDNMNVTSYGRGMVLGTLLEGRTGGLRFCYAYVTSMLI